MTDIIKAQNVYKSYKLGQGRVEVLKGLDIIIPQGQFTAVVGSSGSGKSTLLHILGGLDRPDKGTVTFRDTDINRYGPLKLNRYRNKKIGFVFQFYHLLDELTVVENVMLPVMASKSTIGWFGARKSAIKRATQLLERLGMGHRLKHKPYQLSGGERQRTAIARAVMNDPELLLADEPTGNLDSATGNGILEALEEFNADGKTIVMVTHDNNIAARAQRVIRLDDGKVTDQSK